MAYSVDVLQKKALWKRRKNGATCTVRLHANDVWSTGYLNTQMKVLAKRCGFVNTTRCMSQGKRAEGVLKIVNFEGRVPSL